MWGFGGGFTQQQEKKPAGGTPSWMTDWYSKDRQEQAKQRDEATGAQPNTPAWLQAFARPFQAAAQAYNAAGNAFQQQAPPIPVWGQWLKDEANKTIGEPLQNSFQSIQHGSADFINRTPWLQQMGQFFASPQTGYTPPRLDEGAMGEQELTDPIARRMKAIELMQQHQRSIDAVNGAQNYNWFNGIPNQSVKPVLGWGASTTNDPEDQMWRALRDAGLDTAMGQRTLQQMAGPNWQRALLRSLTPITQPAQQMQASYGGGGWGGYQPSYGGGGGYSPSSYKPVKQNTPAWANGLVNWRIA